MNIDTKRRVLTTVGVVLGVVLGAIVTVMKIHTRPLWNAEEVNKMPAVPTEVRGLTSRRIVVNRNGATVWFKLESKTDCDFGDVDYMREALRTLKDEKLLLTAESIFSSANTPPAYALRVSIDQIIKGYEVNFVFPYSEKPEHYGIYLCTDAEGKKSCHGKPLFDFEAKPEEGIGPLDRVYFFSYFLLRGDTVDIMQSSVYPLQQEGLAKRLKDLDEEMPESEIDSVIATVAALNKPSKLRFSKVDVSESRIKLILLRLGKMQNCPSGAQEEYVAELGSGRLVRHRNDGTVVDITDETKARREKERKANENAGIVAPVHETAEPKPANEDADEHLDLKAGATPR